MANKTKDLREILSDAHAYFYILKGKEVERLKMWDIQKDGIVIDVPKNAPLRKTILGFIPTLLGNSIYEIEGEVSNDVVPDQMPNTLRVKVSPKNARKVNRRLFPRYSFAPPIKITVSSGDDIDGVEGRIINLSAGGLRIEIQRQLKPATEHLFEFDIDLDDETHALALTGTVVYELPIDAGFAYGIRFGVTNPEEALPTDEVSVDSIDKTVDLLGLVNRLIVRGDREG